MKDKENISLKFSNGMEFWDWLDNQCEGCKRYCQEESKCVIEQSLADACFGDGTMRKSLAVRIGFDEEGRPPNKKIKCFKEKELNND